MIVFQDMVNNGDYVFLQDTGLPTLGLMGVNDQKRNRDPQTRENFYAAMDGTVDLLSNHPCICLWTIFNEGWGQFSADAAYYRLRARDPSRFIDSTSGWFHQTASDVDSLHIYFRKLKLGRENKPQLLSEFGGYSLPVPEHCFNPEKPVTRGEFLSICLSLSGRPILSAVQSTGRGDDAAIPAWMKGYVLSASLQGVSVDRGADFDGAAPITQGEAAEKVAS